MRLRYRYVSHGTGPHMLEQIQQMHQLMQQLMVRATPGIAGLWQPPTDVYETEEALVVQAELAGVREEDIDIALFSDYLAISGQRRCAVPPGTAAYHLAGILYGEFRLEVAVIANIRRDDVDASYDNGMLTVVLPKATERGPERAHGSEAASVRPPAGLRPAVGCAHEAGTPERSSGGGPRRVSGGSEPSAASRPGAAPAKVEG